MNFCPFILEPSWQAALAEELSQPYLAHLAAFVEQEYALSGRSIFPPKELIFNSLLQTPYEKAQVIIVGQDPYHGQGQAHGLSFSVPEGIKAPPSLVNIFKELKSDLEINPPTSGCLLNWARQGVLLLNATLTVREGEPLSHHGRGWEKFTDAILRSLIKRKDPLIFVLWGKSAQDKCRFLKEEGHSHRHHLLTAAHPSPFSASNGFFGCRHFSKINEILSKEGKRPIEWTI
ncbi:MAG: uracil-DNA glycosylase [Parachlamydia sp.]|nr:uracil-DNA glycosylase [Parachlamydia sp.]